jgi:hypothetical protein
MMQNELDTLLNEAYRRAVASLPCINCKVQGYSQCAHSNSGKGAGIKASDLDSFPLCTVHPGADGIAARMIWEILRGET